MEVLSLMGHVEGNSKQLTFLSMHAQVIEQQCLANGFKILSCRYEANTNSGHLEVVKLTWIFRVMNQTPRQLCSFRMFELTVTQIKEISKL